MRTVGVGTALLATVGLAAAADLPGSSYYAPAPYSAAYSWAGPYLGANVGYEWGWISYNQTRPNGIAGGLEGGFNWQRGHFVYGVEADIQASGASNTFAPWQFSNPWFGTLRGRAGYAMNNVLFYGTAGLAYGDVRGQNALTTQDALTLGLAAGLGVEVGFAPHWTAKAEWMFLDFANTYYSVTGTNNGLTANLIRMGVNYRF
jgi:outer membrane immunogenic protein